MAKQITLSNLTKRFRLALEESWQGELASNPDRRWLEIIPCKGFKEGLGQEGSSTSLFSEDSARVLIMSTGDLPDMALPRMFVTFARNHCCNFSDRGPGGKTSYCWLEPVESKSICLLVGGKSCKWFVDAVLPADKEMLVEYERLRMVMADANPMPGDYRICSCGKRFRAGSNRQLKCKECGVEQKKIALRTRKRKQRSKWV